MNESLTKNVNRLAKIVMAQIVQEFSNAKHISNLPEYVYSKIELAPNVFLTFQKWSDDLRKPYFLILWRGSKYIMEFDLSRIIFNNNGNITWVLNIPTRKENRVNLKELDYKIENISLDIVDTIYKQMKLINKRANKTKKGYILAQDLQIDKAINKYLEIIEYSIKSNQEEEVKNFNSRANEDVKALEGQIAESKILSRKRNRAIAEQRKIKDKYTCQACRFVLKVNDKYVIECHHIYSLRNTQITGIDDLICLCPTCHRIAHKKEIPYSVSEIIKIRKGNLTSQSS